MGREGGIELSIVLPAYREAQNLSVLLPQLKSVVRDMGVNGEIIVADAERPLDETPEVCRNNNVRHIARAGDDTYGSGVRTGISASMGKYVVIMDADGSHSPGFIEDLWRLRDECDVVIASRYISGGRTQNPWILVAMSYLLNMVYSRVLKLPATDISNSFRLYHGDPLRKLKLSCSHFDIQEEILVKLLWEYSQTFKEIPYHFKKRISGKSKRAGSGP